MVKSKFTPEQKIQIVLESIRTSINTAELCRKHNIHLQTFHNWKQRFIESGKAGLSQSGKKDPIKTMKKREEDYKRLIGELTIANDILKRAHTDTVIPQTDPNRMHPTVFQLACFRLSIHEVILNTVADRPNLHVLVRKMQVLTRFQHCHSM